MKSILRQVDQLQDAVDEDIIERLREENNLLRKGIERGRQRLASLSRLFQEAFESYVVLNHYLEEFENDTRKAGGDFDVSLLQCATAGESDSGGSSRGFL